MHLWRYPSLSIHGIEGAFDEPGAKTVIPGQVIGKFSIRLVPHMNTSVVEKQVTHLRCSHYGTFRVLHPRVVSYLVVSTEVPFFSPNIKGTGTNVKKPI